MRPCLDYSSVTVSELEDKVAMLEGEREGGSVAYLCQRVLGVKQPLKICSQESSLLKRPSSNSVQITLFPCHLCQTEQSGLAVICRQQCQVSLGYFQLLEGK